MAGTPSSQQLLFLGGECPRPVPPPSLGHACLCICRNRDHVLPRLPLGAAIPRPGQHLRAWPRATHTCYGGAQTVGTIGREGRGALIDGSLWSPSPKLRAWSQTSGQDFRAGLRRGGPSALSQSQEAERPRGRCHPSSTQAPSPSQVLKQKTRVIDCLWQTPW